MLVAYFEDMRRVLAGLLEKADSKAAVWIVVSTSAYVGVEIPVDLIIADIASRDGWFLREVGVLRYLRTAGQHWDRFKGCVESGPRLRESVIILDKTAALARSRRAAFRLPAEAPPYNR